MSSLKAFSFTLDHMIFVYVSSEEKVSSEMFERPIVRAAYDSGRSDPTYPFLNQYLPQCCWSNGARAQSYLI